MYTIGELFAGIGGIGLGFKNAGGFKHRVKSIVINKDMQDY
jgi:site-specific DNA-cytosine methylase